MRWAERCFSSLKDSTVRPDIFVVDNGSTDGTQAFIKEHYPEVMLLQSEENLGFGRANNIGFQYALDHKYDYVYLLNQDAWVMDDTFEELIKISQAHLEYGILSPFQMNADMYHIDRNFIVNTCSWDSNNNLFNDLFNNNYEDIYSVRYVMAAHWLMPIDTIKKVGGFSLTFTHYGEDDNYAARTLYHGLKIGIVPTLLVVHDRGSRIEPVERLIYLGYTRSLNLMSDPSRFPIKALVISFIIMCINMVKYKSLVPVKYFLEMLFKIKSILRNRTISKDAGMSFIVSEKNNLNFQDKLKT